MRLINSIPINKLSKNTLVNVNEYVGKVSRLGGREKIFLYNINIPPSLKKFKKTRISKRCQLFLYMIF